MNRRKFTIASAMMIALYAMSGCGNDSLLGPDRGRVRVILGGDASAAADLAGATAASAEAGNPHDDDDGDRPSHWFHTANVTLSSILVRNLDGVLVNLDLDLPVTVDVVKIEHGKQIELPDGVLPIGGYDQVVVVMTAVQGVTHDGTIVTLEPPGGGWTAIVPICPFAVEEGGTTIVGLDLMVRNSFGWNGNRFHFQPRFRANHCPDDEEG